MDCKKAKNKVERRFDNNVDDGMNKALDQLEGKPAYLPAPHPAAASPALAKNTPPAEPLKAEKESLKNGLRFDFVPGERILYAKDFAQDANGELPLTWNAGGKGEVMTISGKPGKWLMMYKNSIYLTGNTKMFGENYTVEFDLVFYFEPKVKRFVLPYWKMGIMSSGGKDPTDSTFLREQSEFNNTYLTFAVGSNAAAMLESRAK